MQRAALSALALILLPSLAVTQRKADGDGHRRAVRFVYEVENRGEKALRRIQLRLVLPARMERQKQLRLELRPGVEFVRSSRDASKGGGLGGEWRNLAQPEIKTDPYGNRVAVFSCDRLAPGHRFVAQWFGDFELKATESRRQENPPTLTAKERKLYLRDAEVYGISDPKMEGFAQQLRAMQLEGLPQIVAIQNFVMDRMKYDRDGKWEPAPVCLTRGTGSCSEYTYAVVALCRALGIPARWTGGLALRKRNADTYTDGVFHRWAECWVPEMGWVPVDASRDDGEDRSGKRRPSTIGKVAWPLLLLARGDGVDALAGFRYHATGSWSGKGGKSWRRGYWTVSAPRKGHEEDMHPAAAAEHARFERGEGIHAEDRKPDWSPAVERTNRPLKKAKGAIQATNPSKGSRLR
jgi:hypothetical protein